MYAVLILILALLVWLLPEIRLNPRAEEWTEYKGTITSSTTPVVPVEIEVGGKG